MFKRKAYQELLVWKEKYAGRYAALLEGARRVGKSTIAENFAKDNYKSYIFVDFSNLRDDVASAFADITNLDLFFLKLQAATGVNLYERDSAIVFDEIQFAPKVRQAIKHLVADGRYDYIETGSLISIKKNVKDILIPSEEMKINVYPMDYEEFCDAAGQDFSVLKQLYDFKKPAGNALNRKLMRDFRIYMAVGGMPQAVDAYVKKKSFSEIDKIKRQIIDLYKDDFNKIDSTGRISAIFSSIPSQLALKKNRFILSSSIGKRPATKDEELLYDLLGSKVVVACYNVSDPASSLNLTKDFSKFKLYMADTGLFTTMLIDDKSLGVQNIYIKLLGDKLNSNLGYLYENAVAQVINSRGHNLYYHTWTEDSKSHPYEVDFLLQNSGKLIPLEVKSSNINNHKSIDEFYKKYSSHISRRILLSQGDLSSDKDLELKPLYFTPFILEYTASNRLTNI